VRFSGREAEFAVLRKRLDRVARTRTGTAPALRGRRQVGKSRLVQEFCGRAGVPYVFSTATKGASPIEAVDAFLRDVREPALPADPEVVPALQNGSWPDAFWVLASVLPDAPSVLVLDELPWLAEQDALFDGARRRAGGGGRHRRAPGDGRPARDRPHLAARDARAGVP
jgi:hypothetical protein